VDRTPLFHRILCVSAAVWIAPLIGCSTMRLPSYSPLPFDEYPSGTTIDGLSLAALPLTDEEEVEEYFGADLLSEGILPVLVIAENQSDTTSFALLPERISLGDLNDPVTSEFLPESSTAAQISETSSVWLLPLLMAGPFGLAAYAVTAPVLTTVGAKSSSDVAEIQYNFAEKALGAETLSPGGTTNGFAYFELPPTKSESSSWVLRVEALNLGTGERRTYELQLESTQSSQ
jgi:hypothetical protein